MLKQIKPINQPWLAIIDHSIDIGTKKVFEANVFAPQKHLPRRVVLRVKMDTLLQNKKAIQLKDCECIGLKVCEKVNGETISIELEKIFNNAGTPNAIIKDCDSTLQKGVRLWSAQQETIVPVIEDIGHVMATALKAQFEKTTSYKGFISLIKDGANRL